MSVYRTTNLRFPEATYEELLRRASGRGVPMAEVVREAVALYLGNAPAPSELPVGADPADALIGVLRNEKDVALCNQAHDSLKEMTGERLPPDPEAWAAFIDRGEKHGPSEPSGLAERMSDVFRAGWWR